MEWILCFLFAICPGQTHSGISPLAQLLIDGQQTLGEEWYVYFVVDDPNLYSFAFSDGYGAVVSISQVEFGSYESEKNYFAYDDELQPYFEVILSNYAPFELERNCEEGNLELYELGGENSGYQYLIKAYIEHQPNAARTVNFFFLEDSQASMEEYVSRFYPELLSCPIEPIETTPEATEDAK